jgi:type I restriction enzyme, R subunit
MSDKLTADKEQHQEERHFSPEVISEYRTRKKYIDVDLKLLGWAIGDDVREEVEVYGMPNNEEKGYADCLEQMTGTRPMMFTTNGFETNLWDDITSSQRRVSGVFSKSDLQKLMNRRKERKVLDEVVIDDNITDRYYQKEAIRAVCENIMTGHRRSLLVMATAAFSEFINDQSLSQGQIFFVKKVIGYCPERLYRQCV